MNRVDEALKWLAENFSATADEFRKHHGEGGDMLLTALISRGYALTAAGRVAVSTQGRARLADTMPVDLG